MTRKAFNFYRSYWDIGQEIEDQKQRLQYYEAIFLKQFEGKDSELNGIAKFAYISQKHSIDKQVEGFYHGGKGGRPLSTPHKGDNNHPVKGKHNQVQEEEEGKEEEKEKQINSFKVSISEYGGTKRGAATELENLKKKHKDWKDILPLIAPAIENQKKYREAKKAKGEFVAEWKNLQTWINQRCWEEVVPTFEEVKKTVYNIPKPNMTGTYD